MGEVIDVTEQSTVEASTLFLGQTAPVKGSKASPRRNFRGHRKDDFGRSKVTEHHYSWERLPRSRAKTADVSEVTARALEGIQKKPRRTFSPRKFPWWQEGWLCRDPRLLLGEVSKVTERTTLQGCGGIQNYSWIQNYSPGATERTTVKGSNNTTRRSFQDHRKDDSAGAKLLLGGDTDRTERTTSAEESKSTPGTSFRGPSGGIQNNSSEKIPRTRQGHVEGSKNYSSGKFPRSHKGRLWRNPTQPAGDVSVVTERTTVEESNTTPGRSFRCQRQTTVAGSKTSPRISCPGFKKDVEASGLLLGEISQVTERTTVKDSKHNSSEKFPRSQRGCLWSNPKLLPGMFPWSQKEKIQKNASEMFARLQKGWRWRSPAQELFWPLPQSFFVCPRVGLWGGNLWFRGSNFGSLHSCSCCDHGHVPRE